MNGDGMKKELILAIAYVLVLINFNHYAEATDYYVSPSGNASFNDCAKITTPCSLSLANQNVIAGDTVYLRGGTYNIPGSAIDPANTGKNNSPITYSNYNNEIVKFLGTSKNSFAVNLNSDYGKVRSYIHIHGSVEHPLTFTNFGKHMWILRGSHNEISYCNFTGSYDENNVEWRGSTIYRNATHNFIHHNIFSNYGSFGGNDDNGVVLEIGIDGEGFDGTAYNRIEYNTISHGGHHVLGVHGNHNVIRYNNIRNDAWWPTSNPAYGNRIMMVQGALPDSQRNLFEYNKIGYGGETSELDQVGGSGGTWSSPYHIVRKNIFLQCSIYGMYFSFYDLEGAHDLKIYNNVFWHNGYSTTGQAKGIPAGNSWDNAYTHAILLPDDASHQYNNVIQNNIFYQNKNLRGSAKDIIEWYPEYDEPDLQVISNNWKGGVDGDPKFVDISGMPNPSLIATQFDFNLQADSGAIDKGIFLTNITSESGSGKSFNVVDAGYFMDGWGIIEGDIIQLQGQNATFAIVFIDYSTNTITVSKSLSWKKWQGVALAYSGSSPDLGVHEYASANLTYSPADTNGDGCISISELIVYITKWKNNVDVTFGQLIETITQWKKGAI
jgi:hypothetical protein